jgi:hypothetical protein
MHPTARGLREKIARRPVLGTFLVEFSTPAVVSCLAGTGFDFILVDTEHGMFSYDFPEHLPRLKELGVQMFGHYCDIGLFKQAARATRETFEASFSPVSAHRAGASGALPRTTEAPKED